MKIIVDAMGGDHAPVEIIKGAVMAVKEFGVEIILTGKSELMLKTLSDLGYGELPKGIELADATEVIEMEDDPSNAVRRKKNSSMAVGLKMLKENAADAMVSAGSTGALLAGATLVVKRIKGIRRAALAPYLPNKGNGFLLIDCGANAECTPEYLLQFAYMGSYYVKSVMGVENPRVGVLNIGTEETKGLDLQKETGVLLKKAHEEGRINFVGNVEAREAMFGVCDVLVTDGFTGNVFLKGMEGVGLFMLSEIKKAFKKNIFTMIGAMLLKKPMYAIKKKMDVSEVGGTIMLGISKPVIKAHGSSDAYAIRSAILQAIKAVDAGVVNHIKKNVEYMIVDAPSEE